MKDLLIECLSLGPLPTNAYILAKPSTLEAVVIDVPPEGAEAILRHLDQKSLQLRAILITHGHWDHFAEAQDLKNKTKAPIYAHEKDKMLLENPLLMKPFMPWGVNIKPVKVDGWLGAVKRLDLLETRFELRHVPGHAPGSVLFYLPDYASAFVGDAIFKESIGRTDLWGGNHEELLESIHTQILTLPGNTKLYPGHGPVTTVDSEKANNPYCKR